MASSFFDSKAYYRLSNDGNGANASLSTGFTSDPPSTPSMTVSGSYSSENWQLFLQSGIYLVRNYDYGADYQLGVTEDDLSLPQLLPSSGDLGMQWNITLWDDGSFKLTNLLLGDVPLFGVVTDSTLPAMNGTDVGAHWNIDINTSAGNITDAGMLSALPSLQTASSTAKSTAAASSTVATKSKPTSSGQDASHTGVLQSAVASSSATSTNAANSASASSHSSSLSGGAIAGIVIGVIALTAGLAAFFFMFRCSRRRKPTASSPEDPTKTALFQDIDSHSSSNGSPNNITSNITEHYTPAAESKPTEWAELPASPASRRSVPPPHHVAELPGYNSPIPSNQPTELG